jgi:lipopolysaccharide/colanic/teichoic acid biosynthesis glycosyltransferase
LLEASPFTPPIGWGAKRAFDFVAASLGGLLVLPFVAAAWCAVVLEDGRPGFFRQPRLGRRATAFPLVKIRTMRRNVADPRGPDGASLTTASDPRLLRCGRFLRTWSIDELPQLWNVLRGEMSVVGPRPEQYDQLAFYLDEEVAKLHVRPGITGLAQVRGRNALRWRDRKRWDRFYARHWSWGLDLWILGRTVGVVLRPHGIATEARPA